MDEQATVYRKIAVERLSSPDQLDQLLRVTRPQSWLLVTALGLLLAAALVWSVWGTIPVTVAGEGLLLRPGGVSDLVAASHGRLERLDARLGQILKAGAPVATIRSADGVEVRTLRAPFRARVLEVLAHSGQEVSPETALVSLEGADEDLVAVLFVETAAGRQLRPGMAARIWLEDMPREEFGYVVGEVAEVAEYPATARGLVSLVADEELARRFLDRGHTIRVDVTLARDPATASGWRWSSTAGPGRAFASRTAISGRVVLRSETPIAQVLPWLHRAGEG